MIRNDHLIVLGAAKILRSDTKESDSDSFQNLDFAAMRDRCYAVWMGEEPHPIQFGAFTADPADRRLIGPGGPIHIGGRAFDVLWSLLDAGGRLVTKDQLFAEVWQGLAVSDAALTSVIRELRIALDDQSKDGMIRAVYGKGYRLEADKIIRSADRSGLSNPTHKQPVPKLAVLPFDDLSPDGDMTYLSDGMSEEILSVVSRGSDIETIGRTSSFAFRGSDKAQAQTALDATHILDGSVRKFEEQVRISAYLLDLRKNKTLWTETFDAGVNDLLRTQTTIASSIAATLSARFDHRERGEIRPEIYDLYLRANEASNKRPISETAIALLERVTREAPQFAPAWGKLAMTLAVYLMESPFKEWERIRSSARDAISRAKTIDPLEPGASLAEFQLLPPYGAFEQARELLINMRQTLSNTSQFHYFEAWSLINTGRTRSAYQSAAKAAELDPSDLMYSSLLGFCLYYSGRLEQARQKLLAEHKKNPTDQHVIATLLSCAAVLRDEELVNDILAPDRLEDYPLREYAFVGEIARVEMSRDPDLEAKIAEQIQSRFLKDKKFDLASALYLARYSSTAAAYDLIDKLELGLPSSGQSLSDYTANATLMLFIKDWPDLRVDPRFAALCARLGLAQFWITHDVWPDCADGEDLGYDFRKEIRRAAETTEPELKWILEG